MWAFGDYTDVAEHVIPELGRTLVEALDVQPGERVLDVAAGSGNAAIPAAARGADVVASDLTPELLERGRACRGRAGGRAALGGGRRRGAAVRRRQLRGDDVLRRRDVRAAPPARGRRAAARDPAGRRIGLISWTPQGFIGQMFATMKPYVAPPPAGVSPPPLWGDEGHVRDPLRRPGHRRRGPHAGATGRAVRHRGGVPRLLQGRSTGPPSRRTAASRTSRRRSPSSTRPSPSSGPGTTSAAAPWSGSTCW